MALKDLLAMVKDELAEVYDRVAYDPTKDRARFIKRIDDTKAKFLQTEPARGKKDFSIANGVVRFTPTLKGNPVVIGGKTTFHIESANFASFLDTLKASVETGELNAEIEAAANGGTPPQGKERKPRSDAGQARGGGWSEERRAKFDATVAARKAAAGK